MTNNPEPQIQFELPSLAAGETLATVATNPTARDSYARFHLPAPTVDELGLPNAVKRFFDARENNDKTSKSVPDLAGLILTIGINRDVNGAALVNEFISSRAIDVLPVQILSYSESPRFDYTEGGESLISKLFQNPFEHDDSADFIWKTVRSRPDCIIVDDIHNEEDAKFAMNLANSGHLVFASISATTSARAIQKIVNLFHDEERILAQIELSNTLIGVFNQIRPSNSPYDFFNAPVFEVLKVDESAKQHIANGEFLLIEDDLDNGFVGEMLSIKNSFNARMERLNSNAEVPEERLSYLASYVHSLPDSAKLLKLHENE